MTAGWYRKSSGAGMAHYFNTTDPRMPARSVMSRCKRLVRESPFLVPVVGNDDEPLLSDIQRCRQCVALVEPPA